MADRKIVQNVQCISSSLTSTGILRLTDHHLVFCGPPPDNKKPSDTPPDTSPKARESWIAYPMISQCIIRPTSPTSGIPSSIRLRCRDFVFVAFNFQDDKIAWEVFELIRARTCRLRTIQNLFAFAHTPSKAEQAVRGWEIYDAKAEFRRQGISEKASDKGWRITSINKNYEFCDTYPRTLVVPSSISDNVLKYAKEYRSRCRIPVLSYLHPINNCTITRSAQPLSGVTRKNNIQDERLVAASFSASPPQPGKEVEQPPARPSQMEEALQEQLTEAEKLDDSIIAEAPVMYDEKTGKRLVYGAQQSNLIVDARPTVNAMVNQIQGMGSEPMDRYPSAQKIFLNIENIHVMRNSLTKVVEAIKDADMSPLAPNEQLLAASDWLKHTRAVLQGASLIARQVGISHSHVLIHCSDGWDRTSQLSALSQLMLDPYYRTIDGFVTLIEKDWLSFGYMFRLRSGPLSHEKSFEVVRDAMAGTTIQPGDNDGRADAMQNIIAGARRLFTPQKEDPADMDLAPEATSKVANDEATVPKMVSPVFHQFLDCVYQLLRQNPTRFEFNERFLRRLLYHLHSCQYGTFLYNSEKQRLDAQVAQKTSSVWDYFLSRRAEFTNKDFDPVVDDHDKDRERIMLPNLTNLRWWHQVFGKSDEEMNSNLNAAAAAELTKATAMANFQPTYEGSNETSQPGTPSRDGQKQPPGLSTSQSVVGAVENAYTTLTPDSRNATLRRSASAEIAPSLPNTLRSGLGKGMDALSNLGVSSSSGSGEADKGNSEQELQQMT